MELRTRQLTLASATTLFVVVAGFVLAWAVGWRWIDGRLVRSAGLFIDSRPRATVTIDGQVVGSTPYRSNTLLGSSVMVGLSRDGFQPWSATLRLQPGEALSIGQLALLPLVVPDTIELAANAAVFTDSLGQGLWSVTPRTDGQFSVAVQGFADITTPLVVPLSPTQVSLSPDHQYIYLANPDVGGIFHQQTGWWSIPTLEQPVWSPDGADVLFGLHQGQVTRADLLARSIASGPIVTSLATDATGVWATEETEAGTSIWRFDPANIGRQKRMADSAARLKFLVAPHGRLVLQDAVERTGFLVQHSARGVQLVAVGAVDRFLAINASQPLAWVAGPDLLVRQAGRTALVDRFGNGVAWVGWLRSPDALVVFDGRQVALYQYLVDKQWHRLTSTDLPTAGSWVAGTVAADGFWYQSNGQVYFWSWRS